MATAITATTPANLSDAAVAIGNALQLAIGASQTDIANLLREALQHLFEAAADAGGQQLEIERLSRYTERLETANSNLTGRVVTLQQQSEHLVMNLAPALETVVEAFNRAAQFKTAAGATLAPDTIRRGIVSEETVAAVRSAPGMAHGD